MSVTVNLDLSEIKDIMCEECKKKLRELIAKKVGEKILEGQNI